MAQTYQLNVAQPLSTSLAVDRDFHRTYTTIYVVFTERNQDPFNAASVSGIPTYGDSYSWNAFTDVWAFAKQFDIQRDQELKDPLSGDIVVRWTITVRHDSKPTGGSNGFTPRDNPLDEPVVITGSFDWYTSPRYRDIDGNVLANSAHIPYPRETVEVDDVFDTINVSYNYATIDLDLRSQMINAVNSVPMWGLGVRRIKLSTWDYQILWAGPAFQYVKYNLKFTVSYEEMPPEEEVNIGKAYAGLYGFYTVLRDEGELYWAGGRDKQANETDKQWLTRLTAATAKDEKQDTPIKLDANGDKIPDNENVLYNIFRVEKERNLLLIPGMIDPLPGPFV